MGGAVIVCLRCLGTLSSPPLTPIVSHGVSVGSLGRGAVCAVEGMTRAWWWAWRVPEGFRPTQKCWLFRVNDMWFH